MKKKSVKRIIMNGSEFIEKYEKTNFKMCKYICDSFIKIMKISNPDRNDMVGSDWISVLISDYYVIIEGQNIYFEPKF